MECLRQSGYESAACRQSAMAYLECRMDRRGAGPGRDRGASAGPGGRGPAGTLGVCPWRKHTLPVASAGSLRCVWDVTRPVQWGDSETRADSTLHSEAFFVVFNYGHKLNF